MAENFKWGCERVLTSAIVQVEHELLQAAEQTPQFMQVLDRTRCKGDAITTLHQQAQRLLPDLTLTRDLVRTKRLWLEHYV